jgi:hypothetical protein
VKEVKTLKTVDEMTLDEIWEEIEKSGGIQIHSED